MDGAYVCLEDALVGFLRICDRVGYIKQHVTTFVDRRTREKLHNYWHVGIAADGFPLRPGVGAFQLALEVRDVLRLTSPRCLCCALRCALRCGRRCAMLCCAMWRVTLMRHVLHGAPRYSGMLHKC